jgi:hypothetical protein
VGQRYDSPVSQDYDDGIIACDPESLVIRGYYFPWGTKHIRYGEITGLQRVGMGVMTGQWRIWGTGNIHYWANLDTKRRKKKVALIVDNGKSVKPFITPDDPDAVESIIRERAGLGPGTGNPGSGPFI